MITVDFYRLPTPGNNFQPCASTSAAVLELANSVLPRARPSNSTSTPNKETWRIPLFLLFHTFRSALVVNCSGRMYYLLQLGWVVVYIILFRWVGILICVSLVFVRSPRENLFILSWQSLLVHSLSRYFFTYVTARPGPLRAYSEPSLICPKWCIAQHEAGVDSLCLYYPFLLWILWFAGLRFVKWRVSLWSRLWNDRYLCAPCYEATSVFVNPIKKWAGICVCSILKWASICVNPIIIWAGISVSPIMNSNNGYLCEPYITSDWSSVCV